MNWVFFDLKILRFLDFTCYGMKRKTPSAIDSDSKSHILKQDFFFLDRFGQNLLEN